MWSIFSLYSFYKCLVWLSGKSFNTFKRKICKCQIGDNTENFGGWNVGREAFSSEMLAEMFINYVNLSTERWLSYEQDGKYINQSSSGRIVCTVKSYEVESYTKIWDFYE